MLLALGAPGAAIAQTARGKALVGRVAELERQVQSLLSSRQQAGFVDSRRGQHGGHALTRPAGEIAVGDLIRSIDGPLAPVRCASLSAYAPCADCADPERCSIRALMRETRSALATVLDGCSLQALSEHQPPAPPWHA